MDNPTAVQETGNNRNRAAPVIVVLLAIVALLLAVLLGPEYIQFQDLTLEQVLKLLVNLSVVALFVERASYVIVRLKYGPEDTKLDKEAKSLRPGRTPVRDATLIVGDQARLSGKKLRLSMSASFIIGIVVAWVGVRCLRPLMEPTVFAEMVNPWQRNLFSLADVMITGALIGGGADGIYQISMTVTDLFKFLRESMDAGEKPKDGKQPNS